MAFHDGGRRIVSTRRQLASRYNRHGYGLGRSWRAARPRTEYAQPPWRVRLIVGRFRSTVPAFEPGREEVNARLRGAQLAG